MIKEWWTPAELAHLKLPDMPHRHDVVTRRADTEGWRQQGQEYPANPWGLWRKREGRGGGYEYHYQLLPLPARAALLLETTRQSTPTPGPDDEADAALWGIYERLPPRSREKAQRALTIVATIEILKRAGTTARDAVAIMVEQTRLSERTIWLYLKAVRGVARANWLPVLAPKHPPVQERAACSPEAWDFIRADYFRPEAPDYRACYRRLVAVAAERGWAVPGMRTLEYRIAKIPKIVHVLARQGAEAAARLYPAQIRDRSVFAACEAVTADGHVWDVFVKYPDGTVGRPIMCGFQDLYSGKLLSWRLCRTENRETVLLAFGDLVTQWGIPREAWLDNGRAFASKWISGGTPNRYRFKVRDTDPQGVLTALGVRVHWTTPYHGQSKPIERAWRDFARDYAKHPAFAGAYVGNSPEAKPENYGSRAVPIDVFEKIITEGIIEWNARPGRKSRLCAGKYSFDEVFKTSYEARPIMKATAAQSRLWLMAAEGVKVRKNAQIAFQGNTYWCDALIDLIGLPVVVRFDIDDLHAGLHVYRLNGSYVGLATCIAETGFNDIAAARTHAQARAAWQKANRALLDAEVRLGLDDLAAMLPDTRPAPGPAAKVIRPAKLQGKASHTDNIDFDGEAFGRGVAALDSAHDSAQVLPWKKSGAA